MTEAVQLHGVLKGIKVRPAKDEDEQGSMADVTFEVSAGGSLAQLLAYVGYAAGLEVHPYQLPLPETPLDQALGGAARDYSTDAIKAAREILAETEDGTTTTVTRRRR